MLQEFRNFILKGNAIDLAVGVLIGAAFGGFVTAFTEGIIKPIINAAGGSSEVSLKLPLFGVIFDVGIVINALISLLITGGVLFFIFVKPMNKLKALRENPAPLTPIQPPAEVQLLVEIRDLLKKQNEQDPRGQE